MIKRGVPAFTLLALAAAAQPAVAQSVEERARDWAAACSSCHGFEGRSASEVPGLAGKAKADLYRALLDFKSGANKTATVMHQLARGYSDAQLEAVADFFSKQKR
ncbi:MAG: c-type cytochrome [Burkholderiales bacterium]